MVLIQSWQSSLSLSDTLAEALSLCPRAEFGFDASLRINYTWYYMPTLHCMLQFSFSWLKGKRKKAKKIVEKEWMSYIGNPEQIWTKSMSVWSCSPSVPAVVEGLCLIQREQKWNSWTWMKQKPPNVCLTNEQGNLFNGVISFLFFKNILFLRESKLKSFPQLRICSGQCQQEWEVSEGQEDGERALDGL